MITPLIHRKLTREDLAQLVAEIGRLDHAEARAAEEAALALWWAGCFPEWVRRRMAGRGMLRAYVTFAAQALALAEARATTLAGTCIPPTAACSGF
ncbi:MAG TPA: hypothetical protein VGQ25_12075 [Gemmatimonadales bacterium]|nr:hypothetical protein [Gemmatimonadales bacterium]